MKTNRKCIYFTEDVLLHDEEEEYEEPWAIEEEEEEQAMGIINVDGPSRPRRVPMSKLTTTIRLSERSGTGHDEEIFDREDQEYVPRQRMWDRIRKNPSVFMSTTFQDIINVLRSLPEASIFCSSVRPQDVPDYHDVVKHPMDLSTMFVKVGQRRGGTLVTGTMVWVELGRGDTSELPLSCLLSPVGYFAFHRNSPSSP